MAHLRGLAGLLVFVLTVSKEGIPWASERSCGRLFPEGVYGFFIQPMYDMNSMTSTADKSLPVKKQ
jgi:hypothetical protein